MRPPMVNSHGSNFAGSSAPPSRSDGDAAPPRVWASAGTGTIINTRLIERVHARALVMLASWASEERGGHARTGGATRRGAGPPQGRSAEGLRGGRGRRRGGGGREGGAR